MNKKYIGLIILLATIITFSFFIKENLDKFLAIRVINIFALIPSIFIITLTLLVNGQINNIMMRKFGAKLKFSEWFGLSIINAMGNYITLIRGGSLANAIYLKKKHKFSYTKFVVFNGGITIISLLIIFTFITTILAFSNYERNIFSNFLFFFFLVFSLLIFILLNLKTEIRFKKRNWILIKIEEILNGWQEIRKDCGLVSKIVFWLIVNLLLISLRDFFFFLLIGYEINIVKLLFFTIFSSISGIVAITPGGLGIKEGFNLASAYIINLPMEKVLIVSLIERLVSMFLVFALGFYYSKKLLVNNTSTKS